MNESSITITLERPQLPDGLKAQITLSAFEMEDGVSTATYAVERLTRELAGTMRTRLRGDFPRVCEDARGTGRTQRMLHRAFGSSARNVFIVAHSNTHRDYMMRRVRDMEPGLRPEGTYNKLYAPWSQQVFHFTTPRCLVVDLCGYQGEVFVDHHADDQMTEQERAFLSCWWAAQR